MPLRKHFPCFSFRGGVTFASDRAQGALSFCRGIAIGKHRADKYAVMRVRVAAVLRSNSAGQG